MSIILNIDTSMETASVSIARDGLVEASIINTIQKEHASFLHIAIMELLANSPIDINQVDAIASTNGPGSYTGLRVGMSSAKGFCYALNKPFITIGTLQALAEAVINSSKESFQANALFCPMIDARRMEIYSAVFDQNMNEIIPASAVILNENSFEKILSDNTMFFFGSGATKWRNISASANAQFINDIEMVPAIARLSFLKFQKKDFTDLSYSEPLYVKEFFSP